MTQCVRNAFASCGRTALAYARTYGRTDGLTENTQLTLNPATNASRAGGHNELTESNPKPGKQGDPDMTNTVDVAAIQARTDAATPGPWTHDGYDVYETRTAHGDVIAECGLSGSDARFIAHARDDVPALLAEIDRMHATVRALHAPVRSDRLNLDLCIRCRETFPCRTITALDTKETR